MTEERTGAWIRSKPLDHRTVGDSWFEPARVVVRFHEGIRIEDPSRLEEEIEQRGLGSWTKLTDEFPGLSMSPVFTDLDAVQALQRRAQEADPTYASADFGTFFYIDGPPETDLVALVKQLLSWQSVREAYIDQGAPDPVVNAADDPRSPNQGYLDPMPDGIDAEYAWTFTGGDGAGQRVIDLERGWTLNHEDINAHGATLLHGTLLDTSRDHGTAVLGEIAAVDNTVGCVGIAPNVASVDVVSFHGSTRPAAIIAALANLAYGDTLLLEAQVWLNGTTLLGPIEAYDAEYEAIRLATALGIIVVEAGGNGTNNGSTPPLNMDTYTTLSGLAILNRDPANPDFRDSGAIIVTAATSAAPHTRLAYAPHGRRIDCYAWGHNINTLASDATGATASYTTGFGGTSGASPIITGAALVVQGRAEAQLSYRFSPQQMRAILSNPATGTPPATTETTLMGVMPNLRTIFDTVLSAAPDVYIRDFVGDVGEPHSGAISASPDIILQPAAVANPQAAYGAGSGTENSATLGSTAEFGQDNVIYVRVLNQGGSPASSVKATVYWAPVATLLTPDLWNLVGEATIASVPTGEVLTVSNGIVWPAAQIPAEGHYCFVGLIGTAADPAPGPADFLDWTNFNRFIRENNNVTWRNFNVDDADPSVGDPTVPKGFKALPFLFPGAPDQARPMELEVVARLPEGAMAALEVPWAMYELLLECHQAGGGVIEKGREGVIIRVNPHGRMRFGALRLPAKSRHQLRLLVHIPSAHRKDGYRVAVRQLWEGAEVGRVTWELRSTRPAKGERPRIPQTKPGADLKL